ncbi:hypothetical protein B0H11DRAFT_2114239 [Mycena galericulata]|nr:hypothetical protein B0H11DRAFT_2114239 [Mycena galericulata]
MCVTELKVLGVDRVEKTMGTSACCAGRRANPLLSKLTNFLVQGNICGEYITRFRNLCLLPTLHFRPFRFIVVLFVSGEAFLFWLYKYFCARVCFDFECFGYEVIVFQLIKNNGRGDVASDGECYRIIGEVDKGRVDSFTNLVGDSRLQTGPRFVASQQDYLCNGQTARRFSFLHLLWSENRDSVFDLGQINRLDAWRSTLPLLPHNFLLFLLFVFLCPFILLYLFVILFKLLIVVLLATLAPILLITPSLLLVIVVDKSDVLIEHFLIRVNVVSSSDGRNFRSNLVSRRSYRGHCKRS